jgi:hypothetical protein
MKHNGKELKSIEELYDYNTTELYELHDRLWYEYFCPKEKHTKELQTFIRIQLNNVGAQIKIEAMDRKNPMALVTIVQSDTKFEMDELGPNWRKPIYVETAEPKPLLGCYDVRVKKLSGHASVIRPVKVEDDEDLLGDAPKKSKLKKSKLPTQVIKATSKSGAKKTNYEIISELAAKGMDKDAIEAETGLARKTITDNLWRYNKTIQSSKKKK